MDCVNSCECGYPPGGVKKPFDPAAGPLRAGSKKAMLKKYFSRFSLSGIVLMIAFGWAGYFLSLWVGFLVYLFANGGLNWQGGSRLDMNSIKAVCASTSVIIAIIHASVSAGLTLRIPDKEYRFASLKKFPLKTLFFAAGAGAGAVASYALCGYLFTAGYFGPRPSEGDFLFISLIFSGIGGAASRTMFFVKTGF